MSTASEAARPDLVDSARDSLSTDEACGALGISQSTLGRMLRRERDPLPGLMVGGRIRILRAELNEWLERQRLNKGEKPTTTAATSAARRREIEAARKEAYRLMGKPAPRPA